MNTRSLLAISFLIALTLPAFADAAISGTVRNSTSAQPAAGDDVILLRFGKGMEEVSRAKTDAQGAFTFDGTSATDQYMVRVVHQGVNYDQTVIGTAPLAIQVFDAVAKIPGLSGSMGIAQVESDGKIVKVTEMYAINNGSSPPVTQAGKRNYDILLPEKAALESVEAKRGTGVWVNVQPSPVSGQPRLYSIDFPLRPGDTLIKFAYRLPSAGPTNLHLRLPYPIKKFAVMHPPSIAFKAERPGTFTKPGMANGWQVEAAIAEPVVGDLAFQVSGIGIASAPSAPARPNPAAPQQPAASAPPAVAAAPPAEAGAANSAPARLPPASTSASAEPQRTSWLAPLAIAGVLMAGALALFWWMRKAPVLAAAAPSGAPPLLEALKEELFQLEVDRAHGSISADEYAETRQAINYTLERAMGKRAAAGK
jgi:hypothetical protein